MCFAELWALGGFGWLVVLKINIDLAIFQPYLDLEAGDNQSLKIQVARPGIEPRSSCSASQELNHSATAAPSIGRQAKNYKNENRCIHRESNQQPLAFQHDTSKHSATLTVNDLLLIFFTPLLKYQSMCDHATASMKLIQILTFT